VRDKGSKGDSNVVLFTGVTQVRAPQKEPAHETSRVTMKEIMEKRASFNRDAGPFLRMPVAAQIEVTEKGIYYSIPGTVTDVLILKQWTQWLKKFRAKLEEAGISYEMYFKDDLADKSYQVVFRDKVEDHICVFTQPAKSEAATLP
jgi:hypothetical protein